MDTGGNGQAGHFALLIVVVEYSIGKGPVQIRAHGMGEIIVLEACRTIAHATIKRAQVY